MQASAQDAGKLKVSSINPIPDSIKNLGIISCDLCGTEKASCDAFIHGIVAGVAVLKRCCDKCARTLG